MVTIFPLSVGASSNPGSFRGVLKGLRKRGRLGYLLVYGRLYTRRRGWNAGGTHHRCYPCHLSSTLGRTVVPQSQIRRRRAPTANALSTLSSALLARLQRNTLRAVYASTQFARAPPKHRVAHAGRLISPRINCLNTRSSWFTLFLLAGSPRPRKLRVRSSG